MEECDGDCRRPCEVNDDDEEDNSDDGGDKQDDFDNTRINRNPYT